MPKLRSELAVDAIAGNRLIELKAGVSSLRTVRAGLMKLGYAISKKPGSRGLLVLTDVSITLNSLHAEWHRATSILRPGVADRLGRLGVYVFTKDSLIGIPRNPSPDLEQLLRETVGSEQHERTLKTSRGIASLVVLKILLYQWLTDGRPVSTEYLERTAGYSYPTVAKALEELGSLIERGPRRQVKLRWFPADHLTRLLAVSDRVRATARFIDRSIQPRSPEDHLRRLEKLKVHHVAIGGVLGARHYFADLDLETLVHAARARAPADPICGRTSRPCSGHITARRDPWRCRRWHHRRG